MACKTSFELFHNFPKLAEESGFTFNTHRPRVHIEWNKIRLVDIESLIRERKFVLIEQHVNDILDCVLESEFDVRILDEGVLKIFRLAQLAVEYHQYCRHYLDRSVYVLREEVTALAQELELVKNSLKEKEEELKKLRKRSKSAFRTSLPYGNDNIATMILKTLSKQSDIFPTLVSTDTIHHNKCTYCEKVFLNQLYLQSHMTRRHANVSEIPQKDIDKNQFESSHDGNEKLNSEITELRSKLADMEKLIINLGNGTVENKNGNKNPIKTNRESAISKEMKDAEVSTNGEGYILDKIEEWKKEEQDKYNKELNLLRAQIIAMLDSFKEKETTTKTDLNMINELHTTIKQQGLEISELKQELTNSKSSPNTDEILKRKEIEAQMSYWVKHAEQQSKEYKLLLQKLDVVAKEAEKSRDQAETERIRVLQLQNLLQEKNGPIISNVKNKQYTTEPATTATVTVDPTAVKSNDKVNSIRDRVSIQKLQQKAQELLNIQNTSSSDNSASSEIKIAKVEKDKFFKDVHKHDVNHTFNLKKQTCNKRKTNKALRQTESRDYVGGKTEKVKNKVRMKESLHSKKKNGIIPGSPMKIIRAKLTEEVNNRLVDLGVDPFKTRLPENIFSRQKRQLQDQQQIKFKNRPGSEQVLHSLRTRLDLNATTIKNDHTSIHNISLPKNNKFFSLSSVISNVKTKALSFVKANDHSRNEHKSYDSVAKKAMMLLKTPPTSTNSSPKLQAQHNSPNKSKELENPNDMGNKTNINIQTLSDNAQGTVINYETDTESTISDNNDNDYYIKRHELASANIENIVKSPVRYPSVVTTSNFTINTQNNNIITPTTSKILLGNKTNSTVEQTKTNENSSDDVESIVDHAPRRAYSVENITKQTKGVLKNASSTSSLNKKKVIFDMDAIQMKSVSVSSPSQSITDKSNKKEKYGLGLINLGSEEWDISSIENEPIQKNLILTRTSPKIAELRETIESQLTRRNNTMSTAVVGGVDVLSGPLLNKAAIGKGGSNTSLGSSILDDTDSTPTLNQVAFVKPKAFIDKDDSEIDISEFVTDEFIVKNTVKT